MNFAKVNHKINEKLVVLIYKRTHRGDPDSEGIFGIYDCMGKVRNRQYDAVIGIGGKKPDRDNEDIAFKVNWIGKSPQKYDGHSEHRGLHVVFSHFWLPDENGPLVKEIAPGLFKYMYEGNRRLVMSYSLPSNVYEDVMNIVKLAEKYPPSQKLLTINKKS